MSESRDLRDKATRCRRLARWAAEREARILNDMADGYEAEATELDKPSP
jgi:hypothetical protein